MDLVPIVLARVRRVLISNGPPSKDTLAEMLRRRLLVLIFKGIEELLESVVATEFKQLHLLD